MTQRDMEYIPVLYRNIQRNKAHLRYLIDKALSTAMTPMDRERVQTSRHNISIEYSIEAADLDQEIREMELRLKGLQEGIPELIDELDDALEKKVVKLRYIKCYNWDVVAELTGYAERHIYRVNENIMARLEP